MVSCERTISVDERSLEESSSDKEETSSRKIFTSNNKDDDFFFVIRVFERRSNERSSSSRTFGVSSREEDEDSCMNYFINIPDNISEDSSEESPKKSLKTSEVNEHICLKVSDEDDFEVNSLSHNQLFKLIVKLAKKNEKLEKNIVDLKDYVEFLPNSNLKLK